MDKAFWQDIIEHDYELKERSKLNTLTKELIEYLAAPDPELRDTFAYGILARWLVSLRYYDADDMRALYQILLKGMNYQLSASDDDTVFLRSYSALILSLIMYRDTREAFLDEIEIQHILEQATNYLVQERDTRAYVPDKGWANATGNICDVLRYLALNETVSPADVQQIMHSIADKVLQPATQLFAHDEEERLAKVALAVFMRDALTTFELVDWAHRFQEWRTEHHLEDQYDAETNVVYQNVKRFLQALYVQMQLVPRIPLTAQEFEGEFLEVLRHFSL